MGEREHGHLKPGDPAGEAAPELPGAALWVIDDIEEGVARLEDPAGVFFEVAAGWLPAGAEAGDVLQVQSLSTPQGSVVTFRLDRDAARERLDEAGDTLERLRRRDPGGNVNL
jgi:hypothetical protein